MSMVQYGSGTFHPTQFEASMGILASDNGTAYPQGTYFTSEQGQAVIPQSGWDRALAGLGTAFNTLGAAYTMKSNADMAAAYSRAQISTMRSSKNGGQKLWDTNNSGMFSAEGVSPWLLIGGAIVAMVALKR